MVLKPHDEFLDTSLMATLGLAQAHGLFPNLTRPATEETRASSRGTEWQDPSCGFGCHVSSNHMTIFAGPSPGTCSCFSTATPGSWGKQTMGCRGSDPVGSRDPWCEIRHVVSGRVASKNHMTGFTQQLSWPASLFLDCHARKLGNKSWGAEGPTLQDHKTLTETFRHVVFGWLQPWRQAQAERYVQPNWNYLGTLSVGLSLSSPALSLPCSSARVKPLCFF